MIALHNTNQTHMGGARVDDDEKTIARTNERKHTRSLTGHRNNHKRRWCRTNCRRALKNRLGTVNRPAGVVSVAVDGGVYCRWVVSATAVGARRSGSALALSRSVTRSRSPRRRSRATTRTRTCDRTPPKRRFFQSLYTQHRRHTTSFVAFRCIVIIS